jgi:hypothetical protein
VGWRSGATTGSSVSASYLDVLLWLDTSGNVAARLCGRRGGFNFSIVGFPCLCGDVPASPACGVCECIAACSMCGSLTDVQSFFGSGRSAGRRVGVAWVSAVSFAGGFPRVLWSLQQSCLLMQPFFGPHVV